MNSNYGRDVSCNYIWIRGAVHVREKTYPKPEIEPTAELKHYKPHLSPIITSL